MMPPVMADAAALDENTALEVAVEAGLRAGIDVSDAAILRISNAILVEFPGAEAVARVDSSAACAFGQWRAARTYQDCHAPTMRLLPGQPRPLVTAAGCVTLWERLVAVAPVDLRELGVAVRAVHDRTRGRLSPELPALGPCEWNLEMLDVIAESRTWPRMDEIRSLGQRAREQHARWQREIGGEPEQAVLVHGDVHRDNAIACDRGLVLIDLESAGVGPASWDLVPLAVGVRRYGDSADDYQRFLGGYGADPIGRPGFEFMCDVYELLVVIWTIACSARVPHMVTEAALRLDNLLGGSTGTWTLM